MASVLWSQVHGKHKPDMGASTAHTAHAARRAVLLPTVGHASSLPLPHFLITSFTFSNYTGFSLSKVHNPVYQYWPQDLHLKSPLEVIWVNILPKAGLQSYVMLQRLLRTFSSRVLSISMAKNDISIAKCIYVDTLSVGTQRNCLQNSLGMTL